MPEPAEIIARNLDRIRERIAVAAEQSGRRGDDIQLIAVTKYVGTDLVRTLAEAGATELGESRPQSLWLKADSLNDLERIRWHLVGHLQRNKVRSTLPYVDLIHSADSERLIAEIDREAAKADRRMAILLEVNISGDKAKHGFSPEQLPQLLPQITNFPNVEVRGLMAMAHRQGGRAVARADFAAVRELRNRLAVDLPDSVSLDALSLGMSADFEEAIAEGSTIVRIGRSLYEGLELPSR